MVNFILLIIAVICFALAIRSYRYYKDADAKRISWQYACTMYKQGLHNQRMLVNGGGVYCIERRDKFVFDVVRKCGAYEEIIIKRFPYDPNDPDDEAFANNQAVELIEKLEE